MTAPQDRTPTRNPLLKGFRLAALAGALTLLGGALVFGATGCAASTHPVVSSPLGTASGSDAMLAVLDQPGPLKVESVTSAHWAVSRAGLVNLDSAPAQAAQLKDGDEPIAIYFHVLRHPRFGTYLIDTGVERAMRDAPERAAMQGMVASAMRRDQLHIKTALGDWLAREKTPVRGVLLSHLHLDHIMGTPDLPAGTALYAGPGETSARAMLFWFTQGTADQLLAGKPPLREWQFQRDAAGRFEGVVDVFGDGSLWAIWTPGHTPGSTSYLARTPTGPVLFVGDSCHTRWGWEHEVEPGSFTADHARNLDSLRRLRRLAQSHPKLQVRLGHQQTHGEVR